MPVTSTNVSTFGFPASSATSFSTPPISGFAHFHAVKKRFWDILLLHMRNTATRRRVSAQKRNLSPSQKASRKLSSLASKKRGRQYWQPRKDNAMVMTRPRL